MEHSTNTNVSLQKNKSWTKNAHYMDISEHRALLADERLAQICVSHIESSNVVYIMTENDYERAMKLVQAMKCIETIENPELFKYEFIAFSVSI
jgi:hypothetical protein